MVDPAKTQENLRRRIAEHVARGGTVQVFGWIPRNHNRTSRKLAGAKIVSFPARIPDSIDPNSHVIFTRFVSHSTSEKLIGMAKLITPRCLTIGVIRTLLEEVSNYLPRHVVCTPHIPIRQEQPEQEKTTFLAVPLVPPTAPETITPFQGVVDMHVPTIPDGASVPSPTVIAFAHEFVRETEKLPDGRIGRFNLAKLLRKHFGPSAGVRTIPAGLLTPHKAEGNERVGWYSATDLLIDYATRPEVPENVHDLPPAQQAERLVQGIPALEARLAALKKEQAELEEQLEKSRKVKLALENLAQVIST